MIFIGVAFYSFLVEKFCGFELIFKQYLSLIWIVAKGRTALS